MTQPTGTVRLFRVDKKRIMCQSCIKYSTNKYQYQYQWTKYQYKYQYVTFKYQYQYQYCA